MQSKIVRIATTTALLAITAGCGGGGVASDPSLVTTSGVRWQAVVVQPTTPVFVVGVSQPVFILVQLVPVNGFFITAPTFFNSFVFANPSLTFACPGLVTISTPVLGQTTVGTGFPFIQIPIAPLAFGSCSIPINLGLGGIFTLNVQVSAPPGIVSKRRAYSVRVTGDSKRP